MKTQIFDKIKYDFTGHPRSYKTTFMPKSQNHICLWTDFDENLYKNTICSVYYVCPKMHFYVMEKFCVYLISYLNTTLTYGQLVKL